MVQKLINFLLYQAGWFAMVLGAAKGHPWKGAFAGLVLVGVHIALSKDRGPELLTVFATGLLGTAVDSLQAFAGVFVFENGYWTYWIVPFWLTVMWMQFATLFHFILSWLSRRYLLSAILGAVGGPVAFLTGERLGGVIFPMGRSYSLLVLACVWALVTPACMLIGDFFRPREGAGQYRFV